MVLIDMSGRFTERVLSQVVSPLWDLKEIGRTGEEIAALLGWQKTAVFDHIQEHGGIRPRWGRNLKGRSLSFEERQEIMIWNSHWLCAAIVDRLTFNGTIIETGSRSYRLAHTRQQLANSQSGGSDASRHPGSESG